MIRKNRGRHPKKLVNSCRELVEMLTLKKDMFETQQDRILRIASQCHLQIWSFCLLGIFPLIGCGSHYNVHFRPPTTENIMDQGPQLLCSKIPCQVWPLPLLPGVRLTLQLRPLLASLAPIPFSLPGVSSNEVLAHLILSWYLLLVGPRLIHPLAGEEMRAGVRGLLSMCVISLQVTAVRKLLSVSSAIRQGCWPIMILKSWGHGIHFTCSELFGLAKLLGLPGTKSTSWILTIGLCRNCRCPSSLMVYETSQFSLKASLTEQL